MAAPDSLQTLDRELRGVFGTRLQSLVAYQAGQIPARTMALVESLTEQDLRACASRVGGWHAAGFATPLLVVAREFARSLDAFPLEFDAIRADHVVVSGPSPFDRARVEPADVRRACEVQARSQLLHLREGFVEAHGSGDALAVLVVESAAPLNALLMSLGRLEGRADRDPEAAARHAERTLGLTGGLEDVAKLVHVREIAAADAERIFPPYLAAVEQLVEYVDGWAGR